PHKSIKGRKLGVALKRKVFEVLDLPEDCLGGVLRLTMISYSKVLVENYGIVYSYLDGAIEFQNEDFVLKITGENLEISGITEERVLVSGKISQISYS
ncbi:MAG: hypothetical protein GX802_08700, partial [Clostridiales bacterium]|nr:hypothetical protein [Clostridiales bacterium]